MFEEGVQLNDQVYLVDVITDQDKRGREESTLEDEATRETMIGKKKNAEAMKETCGQRNKRSCSTVIASPP